MKESFKSRFLFPTIILPLFALFMLSIIYFVSASEDDRSIVTGIMVGAGCGQYAESTKKKDYPALIEILDKYNKGPKNSKDLKAAMESLLDGSNYPSTSVFSLYKNGDEYTKCVDLWKSKWEKRLLSIQTSTNKQKIRTHLEWWRNDIKKYENFAKGLE